MALVFERLVTEGVAEISYLLGDDSEGVAAVFDPPADVKICVELARAKKVSITHIFETHIHADLVSGARELCARVESAKVFVSHEGGARYGFDHEPVADGTRFTFGHVVVTARHTPGHTPEHLSYLIAEKDHPETPWGVLTGDSLFVSSAGRPDLLGHGMTDKLAEQQFHTLRDFYLGLLIGAAIVGLAFGFLLQKGGVAKFNVLIGALLLEDWTVAKVILTAIVVGMIGIFTLHHFAKVNLHLPPTRLGAQIIGGLTFGVGFALIAYCPGTGAAALGQGSWDAIFGMLGLIAGSYLYAELSGGLNRTVEKWGEKGKLMLPDALHVPRAAFIPIFAAILAGTLYALERLTIR